MLCVFVLALFPAAAVAAPISFGGSTFYDIGSVPDCRVISQVSTVSGNVDCCDSCRTGLLLHPRFIKATKTISESESASSASATSVDAAVIVNDKQEKAAAAERPAPLPPAEDGDRAELRPAAAATLEANSTVDKWADDDPYFAPEPEQVDAKAIDAVHQASYPTDKISAQSYHRAITEEESEERSNAVFQMDVVSCNRCISPDSCLAQGMRINTWHRTCS